MPYSIETNNDACANGYAVVKDADGTLIFCHKTRREAVAQIAALNINENYRALPNNYRPASSDNVPAGRRCGNCSYFADNYCSLWDAKVMASYYCNKWQGSAEDRAESFTPTQEMRAEARRGLEWRRAFGRGGTEIGIARARDISNGRRLPYETVVRMSSSSIARPAPSASGTNWPRGCTPSRRRVPAVFPRPPPPAPAGC